MPVGNPNKQKDPMPFGNPNKQKDLMPFGNPINESYNNNRVGSPAQDLTPIILLKAKYIQNTLMDRDLIALIDSGSTNTMIKSNSSSA